jgi:hypothetical protein
MTGQVLILTLSYNYPTLYHIMSLFYPDHQPGDDCSYIFTLHRQQPGNFDLNSLPHLSFF